MEVQRKPIAGYEECYCITATGTVIGMTRRAGNRTITGIEVKPRNNGSGYLFVELCKGGSRIRYYIHRLVAEAFVPNPEAKQFVNHLDGNPSNNRAENLEWVSHSENVAHGYRTGLNSNQKGSHWLATGVIDNSLGQEFGSIREWCDARGINYSTGRNILNGSNRSKLVDLSAIVLTRKDRGHE